jgi:hypothetical protein
MTFTPGDETLALACSATADATLAPTLKSA